jgi:hypothetical protein
VVVSGPVGVSERARGKERGGGSRGKERGGGINDAVPATSQIIYYVIVTSKAGNASHLRYLMGVLGVVVAIPNIRGASSFRRLGVVSISIDMPRFPRTVPLGLLVITDIVYCDAGVILEAGEDKTTL